MNVFTLFESFGFGKAVGFEMLYHESKGRSAVSSTTGDAIKSSVSSTSLSVHLKILRVHSD